MDFDDVALQDLSPAAAARLMHASKARSTSDWARALVPVRPLELASVPDRAAPQTSAAFTLVLMAQQVLRTAVVADRAAGASWTAVGEALNTSKQAAHERWAPSVKEFDQQRDRALRDPDGVSLPQELRAPGELIAALEAWNQLSPDFIQSSTGRAPEPGDVADALVASAETH